LVIVSGGGLEILLLVSFVPQHFLMPQPTRKPNNVHRIGVVVLTFAPLASIFALLTFLAMRTFDALSVPVVIIWYEIAYVLSVLTTFRMYSHVFGMDYAGGIYSFWFARGLVVDALEESHKDRPISAHFNLTKAYLNASRWLHARGLQSNSVDRLSDALSISLSLHPGLCERSIGVLATALSELPDWPAATRKFKKRIPSDLSWTMSMQMAKKGSRTRLVFATVSAVAALIAAIGPVAYAVFGPQITSITNLIEQSSETLFLVLFGSILLAPCFWLWRRVYGTVFPDYRLEMAIAQEARARRLGKTVPISKRK
jgi:hypothetical protein